MAGSECVGIVRDASMSFGNDCLAEGKEYMLG